MRGNSFANGNSNSGATESGQRAPRTWESGYQTEQPVSLYKLAEGGMYS